MGDKGGENPAAPRAAVFLLFAKNRRGFQHPQQGEGEIATNGFRYFK